MSGDAGKPDLLRTFIAIDLPAPVLSALAATQAQLAQHLRAQQLDAAVRLSPVKNVHLTLRFLGDTNARQREQVVARLPVVAAQIAPFTLRVDVSGQGLGGFPNLRQPRVLWAGVGGGDGKAGATTGARRGRCPGGWLCTRSEGVFATPDTGAGGA